MGKGEIYRGGLSCRVRQVCQDEVGGSVGDMPSPQRTGRMRSVQLHFSTARL